MKPLKGFILPTVNRDSRSCVRYRRGLSRKREVRTFQDEEKTLELIRNLRP